MADVITNGVIYTKLRRSAGSSGDYAVDIYTPSGTITFYFKSFRTANYFCWIIGLECKAAYFTTLTGNKLKIMHRKEKKFCGNYCEFKRP